MDNNDSEHDSLGIETEFDFNWIKESIPVVGGARTFNKNMDDSIKFVISMHHVFVVPKVYEKDVYDSVKNMGYIIQKFFGLYI